jgi:hypothetical protein
LDDEESVSPLTFDRQVISGFIIKNLGVNATFGICALWFALLLPITYFCVFETTYIRKQGHIPFKERPDTREDLSNKRGSVRVVTEEAEGKDGSKEASEGEDIRIPGIDGQSGKLKVRYIEEIDIDEPIPAKESYRSRLRIFRGRISDKPFWKGVWKPIPLICYPAILYSTIVHG